MAVRLRTRLVLLVEDERAVRELVAEVLRDEGYVVQEARDGVEAIAALDDLVSRPDLACVVLLDMMLPRATGLDVLRYRAGQGLAVPVIAVSANNQMLAEARRLGATTTMSKPFELEELLALIKSCSQEGHGE